MRGRIRQLKPDLFLDDEFWELTQTHPSLPLLQGFLGLWCHADREGRFEWRAAMLKALILPYWAGDFGSILEALSRDGLVVKYEVQGKAYGWIRNFLKHQRPGNKEPSSCLPPPDDPPFSDSSQEKEEKAHAGRRATLPQSLPSGSDPDPERAPVAPTVPGLSVVASRVHDLSSAEPPREYLDEARMGGVSLAQAKSTWGYYFERGLPPDGVRHPIPWLVRKAKERQERLAKAPSSRTRATRKPLTAEEALKQCP